MIMRFTFSVHGNLRFLSHLDFMKIWARAAKRGNVPIAYSQGFNPHPKLAFTPPRSVGMTGDSEYCDMDLKEEISPEEFIKRMKTVLPEGLDIKEARILREKTPSLMSEANFGNYEITFAEGMPENLLEKVKELLAKDECIYTRKSPKGTKEVNLIPAIVLMQVTDNALLLVLEHNKGVRPVDILTELGIDSNLTYINRKNVWKSFEKGVGIGL